MGVFALLLYLFWGEAEILPRIFETDIPNHVPNQLNVIRQLAALDVGAEQVA
jgi:hypothetical protein